MVSGRHYDTVPYGEGGGGYWCTRHLGLENVCPGMTEYTPAATAITAMTVEVVPPESIGERMLRFIGAIFPPAEGNRR